LPESEAIDSEFASIWKVAVEANEGASRFASGAGRHGAPAS
jgi:enoyl-CoA hydratase